MPPADDIVRSQPLLECVQAGVQGFSVLKVLMIPPGKGHVIPILEGGVFRAEEHRESIHRIPSLIDAAGGELRIMIDSDYQDNDKVRTARDRYIELGAEAGFEIAPITWSRRQKGIDDLYKHLFRSK